MKVVCSAWGKKKGKKLIKVRESEESEERRERAKTTTKKTTVPSRTSVASNFQSADFVDGCVISLYLSDRDRANVKSGNLKFTSIGSAWTDSIVKTASAPNCVGTSTEQTPWNKQGISTVVPKVSIEIKFSCFGMRIVVLFSPSSLMEERNLEGLISILIWFRLTPAIKKCKKKK